MEEYTHMVILTVRYWKHKLQWSVKGCYRSTTWNYSVKTTFLEITRE